MEKTFEEYNGLIEGAVREEAVKTAAEAIGRCGHFCPAEDGTLKPRFYPGFTLITPTYPDDPDNAPLFETLIRLRDGIGEKLPDRSCVKAPDGALHMTVARLSSGDYFEKTILNIRENEFLRALCKTFIKMPARSSLSLGVKGIAVMGGIVAAMVTAEDAGSYHRLQSVRDEIYGDRSLLRYGVDRKRGFKGHITLLYIEDELTQDERKHTAEAVAEANRLYFTRPYPYCVKRAEVRKFENFLSFDRERTWPAIEFQINENIT